jgi:carboxymethylenebutenolidase
MCHSDDSRPPGPPNPGEVAEHGPLTLDSADGTRFLAYQARPARPTGRNVVLLPDIRGLHPFYQDLAVRFAEAGFHTVAIDYFGRTAGLGERGGDFDWQPHVPQVRPEQVRDDVAAALTRFDGGATFTVGFCFGGSHSWRLGATDLDLAGVIGFYGKPGLVQDVLAALNRPMLLLLGGADRATTPEEFGAFDQRLTELGVEHETQVYDGAPHSFFDRAFEEWRPACEDAWRRILDFTERLG